MILRLEKAKANTDDREAVSRRCFIKKIILKNFAKFTGKHICQCLLFKTVAGFKVTASADT